MFFLLGISVLLAALLLINSAVSLSAWLLWLALRRWISGWSAANCARTLFLMRTVPAGLSAAFVFFVLAPAFLIYEPRSGHEGVSLKLALLAVFAGAGLFLSIIRAVASWRATSRLTADWLRNAEPVQLAGVNARTFRFRHRFPLIAVIGIIRPRLFIASQVFETLTSEELSAALEHEAGHLAARDNLKRALMRVCRDMLVLVPFGKNLDRAWLEATESAADDHATCSGGNSPIDLASALVKIARLVPDGVRPAVPAGAFLFSDEASTGFRSRVRRLLQVERVPHRRRSSGGFKWVVFAVLVLGAVLFVDHSQVLFNSHGLTERLVHLLS